MLSTPPAFVLSQDQTLRECLPDIRCTHHESGATAGIRRSLTASSLCFFKGTSPQPIDWRRGINISGVDFWHAVEFSRNGRFLCTHPRDSLRLSSGRFPSVLRFRLYQIFFRSDFLGAFQVPASAFPFPAVPTLSEVSGRTDRPSVSDLSGRAPVKSQISRSRQTLTAAERDEPSSRQLFESTSPRGPCQRLLWGEEETSS